MNFGMSALSFEMPRNLNTMTKYYTVWYWKDDKKIIWATGLTREQAEMAVATILKEFDLIAGIEEE